jgi:hypothetical protein
MIGYSVQSTNKEDHEERATVPNSPCAVLQREPGKAAGFDWHGSPGSPREGPLSSHKQARPWHSSAFACSRQPICEPPTFKMKLLYLACLLASFVTISRATDYNNMMMTPYRCPYKTGSCTKEYRPVICGPKYCKYNNKCLAKLNGFNFKKDCYYDDVEDCPDKDGYCTEEYQPVICGPYKCEYDNTCWAKLNGFNIKRDCYYVKW